MIKKILEEILSNSKSKKSLLGLYDRNNGDNNFCVGYVIDFDETFIVIQHVSKYGLKDGIHVKQIVSLEKIETEDAYLKTCQLLFENQNLLPEQTVTNATVSFSDSWQYHFLNDNSCIGELIAVEFNSDASFYFGFLVDFDEDSCIIHLIGQSGDEQGTNVYHMNDIASFGLDTLECRKRTFMYALKTKASQ